MFYGNQRERITIRLTKCYLDLLYTLFEKGLALKPDKNRFPLRDGRERFMCNLQL